MRITGRWRTTVATGLMASMVLVACGSDDPDTTGTETDGAMGSETDGAMGSETDGAMGSETDGAMGEVTMGPGVTAEACPAAVNPDNGCIYLGQISDLSVGPFAPLAVPITEAIDGFWAKVNADGGIDGWDFDTTTYVEDAEYNAQKHAESYEKIRGDVAALAQSLGTAQTLAVRDAMETDNMVAVPMTWWSGWASDDLVVQTGSNYCVDGMNGVDFVLEGGGTLESLFIVKFPGDYGEDWAVGVKAAAEANGITIAGETQQIPVSAGGDVAAAVGEIVQSGASAVFLATGPTELAQIAGGAAQNGYQGQFIGALPTFNPALLGTAAGPVLEAAYTLVGPYEAYAGGSAAHDEMRAAFPDATSDGTTIGWIQSYSLRSVMESAIAAGDLSREGIRAAVSATTANYSGATPDVDYGLGSAEQTVTASYISNVDTEAQTGISTTQAEFRGSTAEGYDFSAPCFQG